MKKMIRNRVKLLSCLSELIFIVGVILSIIMIVLASTEISLGAFKEKDDRKPMDVFMDEINERIASNYCAMMLEEYLSNGNDKTVFKKYENLNMDFMITKTNGNNNYDEYSMEIYQTGSYTDASKIFHGYGKGGYGYNVDSLYLALYTDAYAYNGHTSEEHTENFWVLYKVKEDMTSSSIDGRPDLLYQANELFYRYEFIINHALLLTLMTVLITVISFVISLRLAAGQNKDGEIKLHFTDKIPFGVMTVVYAVVIYSFICLQYYIVNYLTIRYLGITTSAGLTVIILVMAEFLTLVYAKSLVVRIRSKKFWRYTLVYYFIRPVKKMYDRVNENIPVFLRVILVTGIISIMELLLVALVAGMADRGGGYEIVFVLFFLVKAAEIFGILNIAMDFANVSQGTELLVEGNINSKIDTSKLHGSFKKHAKNINELGKVTKSAVDKQLKSEHLKTELITNVSHDIKTPLTSMINYVDLIKRENEKNPIENEKIGEYIEVLDRQSERLKKLIEDLIEASKASTGNIEVNMESCDLRVLLTQTIGEFADKAEENHIGLVMRLQEEESIAVVADGRLLWRVFGNILENACKYSLAGTRVYIEAVNKGQEGVTIIFKNISKEPLSISGDELMERFVRGDSSRNTEGSGLGLSIATSLMQLMEGEMNIEIDGDMFKTILRLRGIDSESN